MSSHYSMYHQYYLNQSVPLSLPSSTHHMLFSASSIELPIHHCSNKSFHGVSPLKAKIVFRPKCSSGTISQQITDVISKEKGGALEEEQNEAFELKQVDATSYEISKRVEDIKLMLDSEEGEKSISVSAYNTAWVGLVENVNGDGSPQFPSCFQWIIQNQLPDGSWGDAQAFAIDDRLLSTLACVIALRRWNLHPEIAEKGLQFFKENVNKLETEIDKEHLPSGFEIILPSLLQMAKSLNMNVPEPEDSPALQGVFARREKKIKKIPMEVLHSVPSTLLFSLESLPGAQWEKLLKLQNIDGSFLCCPSSTAFAYMQTKDENCLNYLNNVVQKFKSGGVPEFYPFDFFEPLWTVDRLERLGISRYFQPKIQEIMNYVHRNWNEKGIGWTRYTNLPDLDDTSMGFRLLRLNGYEVSADVFKNFEKDGEFLCYPMQSAHGTSDTFNLYRASQLQFPGEKVLEDARHFSTNLLTEKRATNQVLDKWIIPKDLLGEVGYALDFPWYASLPRIETIFYLEQYGGADDVWISKTYYRYLKVNNNTNLELGKLDYNMCQALHLGEWKKIQQWYSKCGLEDFDLSRERLLFHYFLAAATIFEPERSKERLAWVKTCALVEAIKSNYNDQHQRKAFVHEFNHCITSLNGGWLNKSKKREQGLLGILFETLSYFSQSSSTATFNILQNTWKNWLLGSESQGDEWEGEAELLVKMINLNGGYQLSQDLELNPQYQRLIQLSNELCHRLTSLKKSKVYGESNGNGSYKSGMSNPEIALKMQELVQLVFSSNGIDSNMKKTFLAVTKAYYYAAHCDPTTINSHINKVLFERVI